MFENKYPRLSFLRLRRFVGLMAAVLSLGLTGPAVAQQIAQSHFEAFAEELLAGINSASVEDIPAIGGYGKPRIAVAPFNNADNAVPAPIASEYNARLLAELTRRGSGTYRFVARETLRDVIRELDSIEELEAPTSGRVVDLLRNTKVDILVVGALRKTDDAVTVFYKAVSVEDGLVFAATRPREIWLRSPIPAETEIARPVPADRLAHGGRRTVMRAQRILASLGYDPGPRDGVMRPRLRRAIRAYQRDFGQEPTGRMTRRLMRHLRASMRDQRKTALNFP